MPEKDQWESYFSPLEIFKKFALDSNAGPILDFACGFGTFAIPLAKITKKQIYCVDINSDYLKLLQTSIEKNKINNVSVMNIDIFDKAFTLPEPMSAILLFNILHCENPQIIIKKLAKFLKKNGEIFVIHWRSDIETPRGPSLDIRPKPEEIITLMNSLGFEKKFFDPEISSYHYGISFKIKGEKND